MREKFVQVTLLSCNLISAQFIATSPNFHVLRVKIETYSLIIIVVDFDTSIFLRYQRACR